MTWTPPEEVEVCEFILKPPYDGSIAIIGKSEILERFFKGQSALCLEWMEENQEIFRLSRNKEKVYVCVKDIKACLDYWSSLPSQQCQGKCGHFHVCKQFLCDVTHSAISCKQDHDFTTSQHNNSLLEKFSLKPLSTKHMKYLLRNSMPSVCTRYMVKGCSGNAAMCEDVHICGDFVNNQCVKLDGLCPFQHEQALSDTNAQQIMDSFHIQDSITLKRSLVYFKNGTEDKKQQQQQQQQQHISSQGIVYCQTCFFCKVNYKRKLLCKFFERLQNFMI